MWSASFLSNFFFNLPFTGEAASAHSPSKCGISSLNVQRYYIPGILFATDVVQLLHSGMQIETLISHHQSVESFLIYLIHSLLGCLMVYKVLVNRNIVHKRQCGRDSVEMVRWESSLVFYLAKEQWYGYKISLFDM